ncbi:MAG: endonuclease III domain-containing protein, partial [Dehalococcoidia bacterium]
MARNPRPRTPKKARPERPSPVDPQAGPRLREVYRLLSEAFGPQRWWPGETPFEVIVGAILTQSVAWVNVEKAIDNLKSEGLLSAPALRRIPTERLAALLRPCLYFNAKAAKLKAMVQHLARYDDDLARLFDQDVPSLRAELLGIFGVGGETADSIILYAAGKPTFVVDAFTRRILQR